MNTRPISVVGALGLTGLFCWLWPYVTLPPTTQEMAKQAFDSGRFEDALLLFDAPAWRGVAEYRAGRYGRAVGAFSSAESTLELYNLGTAYAQLAEWDYAIAALEEVLRLDPNHNDARHNLHIARRAAKLEDDQVAPPFEDSKLEESGGDESRTSQGTGRDPKDQRTSAPKDGPTESTDSLIDRKGNSNEPGALSSNRPTKHAGTADAIGNPGPTPEVGERERHGSVELEARESEQMLEILLRGIVDDPDKVLRVRLHTAHQNRTLGP